MKAVVMVIISVLIFSCATVEERIKDHSYTDKWYHIDSMKFQVYKTKSGKEYIIILNESETKFIRKYI